MVFSKRFNKIPLTDRRQITLLVLRRFKLLNKLLFSLKSPEKFQYCPIENFAQPSEISLKPTIIPLVCSD